MKLTGKIINKIYDKVYHRFIEEVGITWREVNALGHVYVCPPHQQTKLEQMWLAEILYKPAAIHAGLEPGFDREEEEYYTNKVDLYDAYIAGYMLALTHDPNPPVLIIHIED